MSQPVPKNIETKANVFISYSRKDMGFADRLDAALKARGFEPLIDRSEIYAFEDWWKRIEALITKADTIIFVLSPEAVASDICKREVEFAASMNKRFAPVVCNRVDDNAVPEPLRRFNYIFCDDEAQFEARMDLLAEALSTDIDWIRKHTEFVGQARRWEIAGSPGPRGLLLRSPVLDEAERWIASRPPQAPEPTSTTKKFIAESRRAAKRRRIQVVTAALGITLIAGATATAWFERDYLQLRWAMSRGPKALTAADESILKPKQEFQECARCPVMVVIPAGEFMMGSAQSETDRFDNEGPQHKVTIAKPFAVSKFEVTFEEWDTCAALGGCTVKPGDHGWGRGKRPATVSWNDAKEYVAWISKQTGSNYRLLSEAEWEFVARARTKITGDNPRFSFGDDESKLEQYALYRNSSESTTEEVGTKEPNGFGIYDMHGNVWEWVEDCYIGNYNGAPSDGSVRTVNRERSCVNRVIRGGSWGNAPGELRSAVRGRVAAGYRLNNIGFRLGRSLVP